MLPIAPFRGPRCHQTLHHNHTRPDLPRPIRLCKIFLPRRRRRSSSSDTDLRHTYLCPIGAIASRAIAWDAAGWKCVNPACHPVEPTTEIEFQRLNTRGYVPHTHLHKLASIIDRAPRACACLLCLPQKRIMCRPTQKEKLTDLVRARRLKAISRKNATFFRLIYANLQQKQAQPNREG